MTNPLSFYVEESFPLDWRVTVHRLDMEEME